ncbi:MAG: hypothetical protein CMJ46_13830 [Planctomyces sp.]|nr:hypothetical protein [Planctomyces sp.]
MSTLTSTNELQDLLQSLRKRWQRWASVRIALQSLLILFTGLWLLWMVDTFYFLSAPLRNVGLATVVTTSALWLGFRWRELREMNPTDGQLAALIEESHPELEEQILTAVDYQQQTASTSRLEAQLRQSAINRAAAHLQSLDLKTSLRPARTLRTAALFAALFGGILLFLMLFAYRSAPLQRIIAPWLTTAAAPTIEVDDGNRSIPVNSNVDLAARLTRQSRLAGTLQLQVNWQTQDGSTRSQSLSYDATSQSWPIRWEQVTDSRVYWITSRNSFDESTRYRIDVVVTPHLESAMLTVTPPEYTGLAPSSHDGAIGRIDVPERSRVELTFTNNQAIASGAVVFTPAAEEAEPKTIPLELAADQRSARAALPAMESGDFTIRYVDQHGFTFEDPAHRHLNVIVDQAPAIDPEQVSRTEVETEEAKLYELPVHLTDDYAVTGAELVLNRPGQSARIVSPAEELDGSQPETEALFQFPLTQEELNKADEIEVTLRAVDSRESPRPNETWTDAVSLQELLDPSLTSDPEELAKAQDEALLKELETIREAVDRQQADVSNLASRARQNQPLEGGDRRSPEELIEEQHQLAAKLENVAQQFDQNALYRDLAPVAQHIARHELATSEKLLNEASSRAQQATKDAQTSFTAAQEQLRTTHQEVEQLEKWLKDLIKMKEEVPRLNELARRADELAREVEAAANADQMRAQQEESEQLNQEMEDFFTRNPELAQAAQAGLRQEMKELAARIQQAANDETALNESIAGDLGKQQAELTQTESINERQESLSEEQENELRREIARMQRNARQQQQRAATVAMQSAQQSGFNSPQTQRALELVRQLEETANQAMTGELEAARKASAQAEQTAEQLARANPEMAEMANQLRERQSELTRELAAQAPRPAARHAARRESQDQLRQRTQQLQSQLEAIARRSDQLEQVLKERQYDVAQPFAVPEQFLKKADSFMDRASRRLKSRDYLLARDATHDSAQMLTKAATFLHQLNDGDEHQTLPVPPSFSQQITAAAAQLQAAREELANQSQSGQSAAAENQPEQSTPGESQSGQGQAGEAGQNDTNDPSQSGESQGSQGGQSPANPASQQLDQAAKSLNKASQQLQNQQGVGSQSDASASQPDSNSNDNSQSDMGGTGTSQTLTADELQAELQLLSQRPWGAVSTELQSEIRESSRYRHKPEYARQIQSYFEQLATPRSPQNSPTPPAEESR